jgi:DNA-binding PadR family transcriptional regulator
MKGYLSFLVLWIVSKGSKTGTEIAKELEKRKGTKPSPGTIYPVLKDLKAKGLIKIDKKMRYMLTKYGKAELNEQIEAFLLIFPDMDEMRLCCGSWKKRPK